jgi:hypothetical protein
MKAAGLPAAFYLCDWQSDSPPSLSCVFLDLEKSMIRREWVVQQSLSDGCAVAWPEGPLSLLGDWAHATKRGSPADIVYWRDAVSLFRWKQVST